MGVSCYDFIVGAITSNCSSELMSLMVKLSMPLGLLGFIEGGLKSNIKGNSISDSFVRVNVDLPTIACTTNTPKSIYYFEKDIFG